MWFDGGAISSSALLGSEPAAFLVVSHDRWFLEHVAGRMLDLDPVHAGGFFETRGSYSEFLERKDAALREPARLVVLDPDTLERRCEDVALGEPVIARLSADGDDLYVVGARTAFRLRWDGTRMQRDSEWGRLFYTSPSPRDS